MKSHPCLAEDLGEGMVAVADHSVFGRHQADQRMQERKVAEAAFPVAVINPYFHEFAPKPLPKEGF